METIGNFVNRMVDSHDVEVIFLI